MTINPVSGPAGTGIRLTSADPCPVPADGAETQLVVSYTDVNGPWGGVPYSGFILADGSWSDRVTLTVPFRKAVRSLPDAPMVQDAPPGPIVLQVRCRVGETITREYAPVTFTNTGPSPEVRLSSGAVAPGGSMTVSPTVACPVRSHVGMVQLFDEEDVLTQWAELNEDRTWPAVEFTIPATYSGTYIVEAQCRSHTNYADSHYANALVTVGAGPVLQPPVVEPPAEGVTVALGDSFSSGEANAPYDKPTDTKGKNMCHRSASAWPRQLGVTRDRHLPCSGATVSTLYESTAGLAPDNRSQMSRLESIEKALARTNRHVDTVTLTIGGNDIGFSAIIGDCFVRECLAHPEDNLKAAAGLNRRLVNLIGNIKKAAPRAQIVFVGYPRLFPKTQQGNVTCGWLTPKERSRANSLGKALDEVQRKAAEQGGAHFVSVLDALSGRELCAKDSWFFPVNPIKYGKNQQQAHPVTRGQAAIARAVDAKVALTARQG
jgi:lysophospholipase L1-like esterase